MPFRKKIVFLAYDSAEEVEGSGPELFPHFIFEEGIGDLLIYEYQVRFFKSVNGEVNGKAFLKVRERAFSGLLTIQQNFLSSRFGIIAILSLPLK